MRLFIAIPLPAGVARELSEVSKRLRSDQDGLRWASPESWHITLQFLGNTSPEQYACLIARLREVRSSPVAISLKDLGIFDRAGVFFADVAVSYELLRLQQSVTAATSHCGFTAEDRPFHPHVTLARAKGDRRGRSMRALKSRIGLQPNFGSFTAGMFQLYEAFLGPSGSRYEVREQFTLGNR
jgi:2'-5' RNA ligase